MSQQQAAAVLILPFLVIYMVFLIYPFFRGIWISFHDWNLLAVAFNPDAKEFVGLKNYSRVMWGKNITWSFFHSPFWQTGAVIVGLATFWAKDAGRLRNSLAWLIICALLL